MALVISDLVVVSGGNGRTARGKIAFDSSYPTGGESLTPAMVGLSNISQLEIKSDESGYGFDYDYTNKKIKVYTSAGSVSAPTFTGTSPYALESVSVTYDAAPGGNQIYVKFNADGTPYLACNMATDTADKWLTLTAQGGKIMIKHDASAASGGFGLTIDDDAASTDKLIADLSTACNVDVYLPTTAGRLFIIKNAASGGVALHFDDGADERLEANVPSTANTTFSCNTQGWVTVTPSGSNSAPTLTGSAAEIANATNLSALTVVEFEAVGV